MARAPSPIGQYSFAEIARELREGDEGENSFAGLGSTPHSRNNSWRRVGETESHSPGPFKGPGPSSLGGGAVDEQYLMSAARFSNADKPLSAQRTYDRGEDASHGGMKYAAVVG